MNDEYKYKIIDKKTRKVVGKYKTKRMAITKRDKLDNNYGSYNYLILPITSEEKQISEVVSTSSIAVNLSPSRKDMRNSEREWRDEVMQKRAGISNVDPKTQEQLKRAKELKKKKSSRISIFNDYLRKFLNKNNRLGEAVSYTLIENYDVSDVVSRMKGLENKNMPRSSDSVTYGVEDDEGNIMKVTVKGDQAKDFENRLSMELGEIETDKIYGYQKSNISMAELLFKLKNDFEILDVEFPTIPSDVIYNQDKATYGASDNLTNVQNSSNDGVMNNDEIDVNMNEEGDDMSQMADSSNTVNPSNELDDGDFDQENVNMDDENVEDFDETDSQQTGYDSIFQSLIQMMTSQAEAAKAQAEAEAEKARALTAEYTAKSAQAELSQQEELARMQAELDDRKKKEKEAKKLADLAKYRVQQGKNSTTPTFESFFTKILENLEVENKETEPMIRRQMSELRMQYQILPTDDIDTQNYKKEALKLKLDELNAKLRLSRITKLFNAKNNQNNKDNSEQQKNQTQQTNNQLQQNNQNNTTTNVHRSILNGGQRVSV